MMRDEARTPTTRFLALTALVLAVGVFLWRANAGLSVPERAPQTTGSAQEQELSALISPLIAGGAAQVSIRAAGDGTRTVLIVVPEGSLDAAALQPVLVAAAGYRPGQDQLSVLTAPQQIGFSQAGILELSALGGLCVLLLILTIHPGRATEIGTSPRRSALPAVANDQRSEIRHGKTAVTEVMASGSPGEPALLQTAKAAEAAIDRDPDAAISLLRTWMGTAERGRT